jgi:hypothetical protein
MKVPPGRGRRHVTRIRFMVEAGIDAVLWGESDQGLEDELAIPEDLRHRMKRWRREYDNQDGGVSRPWTGEEHRAHDRTGYEMSRELQEVLGPTYRVDYVFTTGGSGQRSARKPHVTRSHDRIARSMRTARSPEKADVLMQAQGRRHPLRKLHSQPSR